MKRVGIFMLLCTIATMAAAATPNLPKKKFSFGPFDLTLGYDHGAAATLKGEYVTALGAIDSKSHFTWGSTLNVDAVGNTSSRKADNATFGAGIGRVSVKPNSFFPDLAAFLQVQGKTGQVAKDGASGFDRVNQVAVGGTIEYVPKAFLRFVMKGHESINLEEEGNRCVALSSDERAKDAGCQLLDCSLLGEDELKNDATCKALIEAARKKAGAIEAPPMFAFGFFHPLRTSGGDIGDLPNGVDANKITVEFVADNHVGRPIYKDQPLHVTANLSVTYPTSGADKKLERKLDVGVGIDLTAKFTPIVKYVSGKKDGFTYDKSVIVGFLLDLTKLKR